jgi:hypothetical protein
VSTFTLPVNGTALASQGTWNAAGGSVPTIITDGNAGTYVYKNLAGSSSDYVTYPCTDLSLPANEYVYSVAAAGYAYGNGSPQCQVYIDEWYSSSDHTLSIAQAFINYFGTGPAQSAWGTAVAITYRPKTVTAWTQAAVNATAIRINDQAVSSSFGTGQWYELGLRVATKSIPVAPTITSPTGTLATSTATVSWTHVDTSTATVTTKALTSNVATITTSAAHGFLVGNDVTVAGVDSTFNGTWKITAVTSTTFSYAVTAANVSSTAASGTATIGDGAAQVFYQVGVFTSAQYGIGGFDPASSPSSWSSGSIRSVVSTITTTSLLPGAYRAYVRTGKTDGVNSAIWSTWAFSSFTVAPVQPPTPTVSAAWDSTNQRATLTLAGFGNLLSAQDADLEDSTLGAGSWSALTNCASPTRTTAQASSGAASLLMSSSAAGTMDAITATGVNGEAVISGVNYSATADFRAATVARTCLVKIRWYNSSGSFLSDSAGTGSGDFTGSWLTRTVTATAPANAAFAAVIAEVQSTAAASEVHYVDKIAFHPGSTPTFSGGGASFSFTVSRTVGGISTAVRGPFTMDVAERATVYDYEVERNASATYTVTELATYSYGVISSPSAVSGSVSSTSDGTWWLKAPASPSLNTGSVRLLAEPTEVRVENLGVFRVDGRTDPVVVAGQTFGDDIQFQVYTSSAAEFEDVKALLTYQGTLLLQEPFLDSTGLGLQRYVRITDRQWIKQGTPTAPRRVFSVTAIEVGQGY